MNFLKRYGALLLVAVAILMAPRASFAALTLTVSDLTTFQQTTNNPCVIGDASCKQPTPFPYSQFNGNPGSGTNSLQDWFSPAPNNTGSASCGAGTSSTGSGNAGNGCIGSEYTVGFITGVVGTSFKVGIDVNYATGQSAEDLVYFHVIVGDTGSGTGGTLDTANSFDATNGCPAPTALANGGCTIVNRNGNGYSDAVLSTINLSTYASNARIKFEVKWANDTDGMEEFFLIAGTSTSVPTPEPASIFMLGSTLIGIGALARRRWNLAKRS